MPSPAPSRSPWVAVGVILVGSYSALLNMTVVGVALPAIASDIGGGTGLGADWVVTAFLVGVVAVIPVTGWAADRFGRKQVYVTSLLTFAAGSLLCAIAPSLETLVAARVLQGLGAGAVMPIGMVTVYDLFPPARRGTAMGVWGVAMMAAPAVGPPLGGWVVDAASWRLLFVVFGLVAVAATGLTLRYLPDVGHRERRPLDSFGWVIAVVAVVAIVIGSRELPAWGLTSLLTVGVLAIGLVASVVLVVHSRRHGAPLIDLRLLAVPVFAAGMIVVWLTSMVQFVQLTFLPVELQVARELDPSRVGLLLAPAALGVAVTMPIGGWLADRIGARGPVLFGLVVTAVGTFRLGHLQPDGDDASLVMLLLFIGIGQGFAFIPTTVAAMGSLPDRHVAQASVVNSLCRQLSGAVGAAVLAAIVVAQIGAVSPAPGEVAVAEAQLAYNRVFLISAATCVVGIVAACWLPGRRRMHEQHAARAAERAEMAAEPVSAQESRLK